MPCSIIVVREELSEKQIHIWTLLSRTIVGLQLSVLIWWYLVAVRVVVAQIEAVQILSVTMA